MPCIALRWIGIKDVEPGVMEWLASGVGEAFGVPARILERAEGPADAFEPARGQSSSTRILRWMLAHRSGNPTKAVSITDADLFIPVLTFVFGEAQVGGAAAVVSTARLEPQFYGLPPDPARFRARLLKECLHELGHTFGLVHCRRPGCVMTASLSVLDVDAKRGAFCGDCRVRLRELAAGLPLRPGEGKAEGVEEP